MSRDLRRDNPNRNGQVAGHKPRRGSQLTADSIDHFIQQWRRERPDLDPTPVSVFARIFRVFGMFSRRADIWLSDLGLTWEAFSLIVTLRRSGKPFALRPGDLLHESLLSSGAMTNRIDRVEQLGLVRRVDDPKDRRGVVVQLTPAGRTLADRAIERHFDEISRLLSPLNAKELSTTAALLSKLLISLEGPYARDSRRLPASQNADVPARQIRNRRSAVEIRASNALGEKRKPLSR